MSYNTLTEDEKGVIENQATERPFTGEYDNFFREGTFICRRCNSPLYSSRTKFDAGCGWPAFDENFPNAVKRISGFLATEIECSHCSAHLGHVFEGEHFTEKDNRHCVNSLSLRFINARDKLPKIKNA